VGVLVEEVAGGVYRTSGASVARQCPTGLLRFLRRFSVVPIVLSMQSTACVDDGFLARLAQRLVDESAVEMTSDRGAPVEVWTVSSDGARVVASAPRLEVATDMRLRCRLVVDGATYQTIVVVEEALFHSPSRAKLVLRVVDAVADQVIRRADRVPVSVRATMTPVVCDRIVPGEVLVAGIDDVSIGGFQAVVSDSRVRVGDRLRLGCRCLDGVLDCDVRVKWVARGARAEERRVGCAFIDPSVATRRTIERLIIRFGGQVDQESLWELRRPRFT
jgi:PilZ domain